MHFLQILIPQIPELIKKKKQQAICNFTAFISTVEKLLYNCKVFPMEKVQNIYCAVCLTVQRRSKFPPNFVLQFINCPRNIFTETLFTNCRHILAMGLSAVRRVSHGALSIAEYRQDMHGARGWLLLPSLPCDVLWVFLS